MPDPYDDAPRLPEGDRIDVRRARRAATGSSSRSGRAAAGSSSSARRPSPGGAASGLEIRRKWAAIVDGRLAKRGLGRARARLRRGRARSRCRASGRTGRCGAFFVHFPDPWWKKRHQKRLVMKDGFLEQVARLLEPGGELFVQTDVEERAAEYEHLVALDPRFVPAATRPARRASPTTPTSRAARASAAPSPTGFPVHRMRWRRA